MVLGKNRLEAFSDGVLAIIITIMVLELRAPHADSWAALRDLGPTFVSYVLSFVYVGIYWNNHHHMLHATRRVNGAVLWANMYLLFWLSLFPFVTSWMGENHFSLRPIVAYGFVLLMAAIAYVILSHCIIRCDPDSPLKEALGPDLKGKASIVIYISAMGLSFVSPWIGFGLYWTVALIWLVPDTRIERVVSGGESKR